MESNERLLTEIRDGLRTLSDGLLRPFPDLRIYSPDETCSFFQLSGAVRAIAGNDILVSFQVPPNQRGVIAQVQTIVNPTGASAYPAKNEGRIIIKIGANPPTKLTVATDTQSIAIHGSLSRVIQGGNSLAQNVDGIALSAGTSRIQTRIALLSGETYTFYRDGGSVSDTGVTLFLFGWTFPNTPRK